MDTKTRKCVQSSHFFHEIKSADRPKNQPSNAIKIAPAPQQYHGRFAPEARQGMQTSFHPAIFPQTSAQFPYHKALLQNQADGLRPASGDYHRLLWGEP